MKNIHIYSLTESNTMLRGKMSFRNTINCDFAPQTCKRSCLINADLILAHV